MVKMDVGTSATQAETGASACKVLIESLIKLSQAVLEVQSIPNFSGSAADSAKNFASSVVIPTIRAGVLLVDAIDEGLSKLLSDYQSKVDSDSHDSEKLERDIKNIEDQIRWAEVSNQILGKNSKSRKKNAAAIKAGNNRISALMEQKKELDRILKALLEYDPSSSDIFSEIETLNSAFSQGITQINSGYNTSTHEFSIPQPNSLSWAADINGIWNNKVLTVTNSKSKDSLLKKFAIESTDAGFNELFTKGVETIGKYSMFAGQAIGKSIKSNAVYIPNVGQALEQSGKLVKAGKIVMKNSGKVLSSIGFGVGMYDDIKNEDKTFGEAIAHNGIGLAITTGASLVLTPVGGIMAGAFYEAVYSDESLNLQEKIDSLGRWIDETGLILAESNRTLGQALQLR